MIDNQQENGQMITSKRTYKKRAASREDKELRDKQFVKLVSSGVSSKDACIALGYAESAAESNGSKLKRRLQKRITEATVIRLQGYAIKSLNQVRHLALKAEHESVRLKACTDLLDRAGWKAVTKVEQTTATTMVDRTTAELEEELKEIMNAAKVTTDATGKVALLPGVTQDDIDDTWVPLDNLETVGDTEDDDDTVDDPKTQAVN